jgi:hypothetical protein
MIVKALHRNVVQTRQFQNTWQRQQYEKELSRLLYASQQEGVLRSEDSGVL